MMARALQLAGHTTLTAENGEAALGLIAEHSLDLVITDIYMAGMNGIELIQRLRDGEYSGPILAISGDARYSAESLGDARLFGADAALEKPFALAELTRVVRSLLGVDD